MIFDPALIQALRDNGIDPRDVDPALIREDRDKYRAALAEIHQRILRGAASGCSMNEVDGMYCALAVIRSAFEGRDIDPAELDPTKGAE